MCMATKTITITVEAYEKLKRMKEERESFSDVINRMVKKRSLLELAGILNEKEGEEFEKAIKEGREGSKKRMLKIKEMFEN